MPTLPPCPRQLRIFPSRRAAAHALTLGSGDCIETAGLTTFADLYRGLGDLIGRHLISSVHRLVLLRHLLCRSSGWLREVGSDLGQVRVATAAVAELRNAGITAAHLDLAGASPALTGLGDLLGRYEAALDAARLCDEADLQRQAVLKAAQGELPPIWRQVREITVEGGGDLVGAPLHLLTALAARGAAVRVRMPWDPRRPHAFAWPEASLAAVEAETRVTLEVQPDPRVGDGPLAALRAAQFTAAVVGGAPLRLRPVGSGEEEARLVALEVRRFLQRGAAPEKIAVATPDLDRYGPSLVRALRANGVYAALCRGVRLTTTRVARILDLALRLPEQGYPREALLDLFCDLGESVAVGRHRLASAEVARWVRRSGARSARLGGYRRALVELGNERDGMHAATATAVADAVDRLSALVDAVPAAASLAEHARALAPLVAAATGPAAHAHVWPDDPDGALHGRRDRLQVSAAERAAREAVAELRAELAALDHQHASVGGTWTRRELCQLANAALFERRVESESLGAAVTVLGLSDLVETRFERVVLTGIDADGFPRPRASDPFLSEELRFEINRRLGTRLVQAAPGVGKGALRASSRDLWLWLEALGAASHEIVVSFRMTPGEPALSEVVEELYRSTAGSVDSPGGAQDGEHDGVGKDGLLQAWSLARHGGAAAVRRRLAPGASAALDAVLRDAERERLESIEARVAGERRLQGPARCQARIGGAQGERVASYFAGEVHGASAFDRLGVCAFKFFAADLLGLKREELPTLGPDPREQGSAAHAGLELIYRDLIKKGGLREARRDPDACVAWARELFLANAGHVLREVRVHDALRASTLEGAWTMVRTVLRHDLAAADEREPVAVEWRFGLDGDAGNPPLAVTAPDGSRAIRVRGSIDRVDRAGDTLRVLDYKRRIIARVAGRHFQLPLYALVALRELGGADTRIEAAWVGLKDGKAKAAPGLPERGADCGAVVARDVWQRVARLQAGDVSPDPESAAQCARCEFRPLCRYEVELDPEREAES